MDTLINIIGGIGFAAPWIFVGYVFINKIVKGDVVL